MTDEKGVEHAVLNAEKTQICQNKQEFIKSAWSEWIEKKIEHRNTLERIYNDSQNDLVQPEYDGSKLSFPGMSSNAALKLLNQRTDSKVDTAAINAVIREMAANYELRGENGNAYLCENYTHEDKTAQFIVEMLLYSKAKRYKLKEIAPLIKKAEDYLKIELSEKQQSAVEMVLENPVSVITGGAGTGKTTVLKVILYCLEQLGENLSTDNLLLAAPTGKAAIRMTEATGYSASTIHRGLGLMGEEEYIRDELDINYIDQEIVVCDEFSMCDMNLAYRLFIAVPRRQCRVLLLGDVGQLPSVGAGNVLNDIIESGVVPVTKLDVIFRQAQDSGLTDLKKSQLVRAEFHLYKWVLAPNVVECLAKMGYANLVIKSHYSELNEYSEDTNAKRLFIGLKSEYRNALKDYSELSIHDIPMIHQAQRLNVSPEELKNMMANCRHIAKEKNWYYSGTVVIDFLSSCEKYNVSPHKAFRYFTDRGNDYQLWLDYAKWSVAVLGADKIKRNSLLVAYLYAAHDRMFRTYEQSILQDSVSLREMNEKCIALYQYLLDRHLSDLNLGNGFGVVVPKDKIDFALEGHRMHICVGGDSYFRNHVNGESLVFFLRQAESMEKSFACCEATLSGGKLILKQCRMHHNGNPPEKVEKAAKQYIEKLNKVLSFENNTISYNAAA